MSRQVPHVEDLATGTPTSGLVPVSAGPGLPPAWGSAGGGGGGGGFTLLAEKLCTGGEQTIRLPASGSLTGTWKELWLTGIYRPASAGGSGNQLGIRLNDDVGSNYIYVEAWDRGSGAGSQEGTSTGFTSDNKFYASGMPSASAPANAPGSFCVRLPMATRSDFWQPIFSQSSYSYFDETNGNVQEQDVRGFWKSLAAITSVTVWANTGAGSALSGGLAANSYFALYGVPADAPTGGGVWTEIATLVAVGGESVLDFTSIPNTFRTLVAIGDSLGTTTDATASGDFLSVEANAWDGSDYIGQEHYVRNTGSGAQHGVTAPGAGQALEVSRISGLTVPSASQFVCWFPGYAVSGTYKHIISQGVMSYGNGYYGVDVKGFVRLGFASSTIINELKFFVGAWSGSPTRLFAAGSRITLYGVS